MDDYNERVEREMALIENTNFIDYLPLMGPTALEMLAVGLSEEEKLKRDLAKQNYLNIHKRRKKK